MRLRNDSRDCSAGSVGVQCTRERGIEVTENGACGKSFFDCIEGSLYVRRPVELGVLSQKLRDRENDARVTFYEPTIEVRETEEDLDIVDRFRDGPIDNGRDPVRFHGDSLLGYDEAKEGDLTRVEETLLKLDVETVFEETFEDLTHVLNVLFKGIRENQDIIEVDNAELINEFAEDVIDIRLEGAGCAVETKRHDQVFKLSVAGSESGFVFFAEGDPDEIECISKIQLGEELFTLQMIKELRNQGQGIMVLDGDTIKRTIIDTQP